MSDWSRYDRALQVGDVVTGYAKGYWRIVSIQRRFLTEGELKFYPETAVVGDEYNPLVHLELVCNSQFTKRGKRTSVCDISYCRRVNKSFIDAEIKLLEKKIKAFRELEALVAKDD
jgi:hypothetical protein